MLRMDLKLRFDRPWVPGAGASASASAELLTLVSNDGWTADWDASNPDTGTTRESGGSTFISAIADGLNNAGDLAESTASLQPILSNDLILYDGADDQLLATLASGIRTADMRFYLVVDTAQADRFILISANAGLNLGTANPADANPATNDGTLWVDGVEKIGMTRGELHTALTDGAAHLVEVHGIDGTNTSWTAFKLGGISGGTTWTVDGSLGPLLLAETSAISAGTHTDVRNLLADTYGITLA